VRVLKAETIGTETIAQTHTHDAAETSDTADTETTCSFVQTRDRPPFKPEQRRTHAAEPEKK